MALVVELPTLWSSAKKDTSPFPSSRSYGSSCSSRSSVSSGPSSPLFKPKATEAQRPCLVVPLPRAPRCAVNLSEENDSAALACITARSGAPLGSLSIFKAREAAREELELKLRQESLGRSRAEAKARELFMEVEELRSSKAEIQRALRERTDQQKQAERDARMQSVLFRVREEEQRMTCAELSRRLLEAKQLVLTATGPATGFQANKSLPLPAQESQSFRQQMLHVLVEGKCDITSGRSSGSRSARYSAMEAVDEEMDALAVLTSELISPGRSNRFTSAASPQEERCCTSSLKSTSAKFLGEGVVAKYVDDVVEAVVGLLQAPAAAVTLETSLQGEQLPKPEMLSVEVQVEIQQKNPEELLVEVSEVDETNSTNESTAAEDTAKVSLDAVEATAAVGTSPMKSALIVSDDPESNLQVAIAESPSGPVHQPNESQLVAGTAIDDPQSPDPASDEDADSVSLDSEEESDNEHEDEEEDEEDEEEDGEESEEENQEVDVAAVKVLELPQVLTSAPSTARSKKEIYKAVLEGEEEQLSMSRCSTPAVSQRSSQQAADKEIDFSETAIWRNKILDFSRRQLPVSASSAPTSAGSSSRFEVAKPERLKAKAERSSVRPPSAKLVERPAVPSSRSCQRPNVDPQTQHLASLRASAKELTQKKLNQIRQDALSKPVPPSCLHPDVVARFCAPAPPGKYRLAGARSGYCAGDAWEYEPLHGIADSSKVASLALLTPMGAKLDQRKQAGEKKSKGYGIYDQKLAPPSRTVSLAKSQSLPTIASGCSSHRSVSAQRVIVQGICHGSPQRRLDIC